MLTNQESDGPEGNRTEALYEMAQNLLSMVHRDRPYGTQDGNRGDLRDTLGRHMGSVSYSIAAASVHNHTNVLFRRNLSRYRSHIGGREPTAVDPLQRVRTRTAAYRRRPYSA